MRTKIKELNYENKIHTVVTYESTHVLQKEFFLNILSQNNLFINQTYLLGTELLQQGVPKEWLNHLTKIERPF